MVRTEISTTYSQLVTGDTIWLDDQANEITNMTYDSGAMVLIVKDPQGGRHVLHQNGSDPVYRAAR